MKLSILSMACLLLMTTFCIAHPSDGYEANNLPFTYKNGSQAYPVFWDQADLKFLRVFPSEENLSPAEKYIIAGTKDSAFGFPLEPWSVLIFGYIRAYYAHTGEVPQTFSPSFFNDNLATEPVSDERLSRYKNPITGDYPTFNNAEFVPGGMYVRVLTPQEMEYYAGLNDHYNDIWFENRVWNEQTETYDDAELLSPVFYMRIYGDSGLLATTLKYKYRVSN